MLRVDADDAAEKNCIFRPEQLQIRFPQRHISFLLAHVLCDDFRAVSGPTEFSRPRKSLNVYYTSRVTRDGSQRAYRIATSHTLSSGDGGSGMSLRFYIHIWRMKLTRYMDMRDARQARMKGGNVYHMLGKNTLYQ